MTEEQFESEIVADLVNAGYSEGQRPDFDIDLGLDTVELLRFIQATQAGSWATLEQRHGGEARARDRFLARVAGEVGARGVLNVLREGVADQQVDFRMAYFKPATSMNAATAAGYAANRLSVTRQLRYSRRNSNELDLCLFVNGLPVSTVELKNQLTGQDAHDAVAQYKTDRDPRDALLSRCLVHFAVSPSLVYLTTQLKGRDTEFLPFNLGTQGGAGNPTAPGYATSYLWQQVWERDAWLDLLNNFVLQPQDPRTRRPTAVTFPRYHQWDGVRQMRTDAKANRAGRKYLIQHSAGSGKTMTISWLAHQLSSLHTDTDERVFDKVIVLTDRRVLDEQLRTTVLDMQRVRGTVVSVQGRGEAKSAELLTALRSQVKIVVATVQTFPYLVARLDTDRDLAQGRYAILIDEAHSSTTGEALVALKQALGAEAAAAALARANSTGSVVDDELLVAETMAARTGQSNISFFAFTATPKARTLEMFGGRRGPEFSPFHVYSMRQAIEEGFILDVLQSYTPYNVYYRLAAPAAADREVEARRGSRALHRLVVEHPDMIQQKAALIAEHVRAHTIQQVGGRGKAMLVCETRRAAASYKLAIDAYCRVQGYHDLRTLVAFSDAVDIGGEAYTEAGMNGFPEHETAARFKGVPPHTPDVYHVMIAADKFQVGFDDPTLHTMFVDKRLGGVTAVQTLSRLNRRHRDKASTFILDFVNDPAEIAEAFKPWIGEAIALPTDVNALSDLRASVLSRGVMSQDEAQGVAARIAAQGTEADLSSVYAELAPLVARGEALEPDELQQFRRELDRFLRLYNFLSQILPYPDRAAEQLYLAGRALYQLLPAGTGGGLLLGDDVVLTHLSLVAGATQVAPVSGEAPDPLVAFPGSGRPPLTDHTALEPLGELIERINERYGLELTDAHRLAIVQVEEAIAALPEVHEVARVNTLEDFMLELPNYYYPAVTSTQATNRALLDVLAADPDVAESVMRHFGQSLWHRQRATDAEVQATNNDDAGPESGVAGGDDNLLMELRQAAALPPGWLDGTNPALGPQVVVGTQLLLDRLAREGLPQPLRLLPDPEGGVDLQWRADERAVSVTVEADGLYFVHALDLARYKTGEGLSMGDSLDQVTAWLTARLTGSAA